MAERLKDNVALVIGAANSIGLAIADLITPRSVISHLRTTNKRQALQDLAKRSGRDTEGAHLRRKRLQYRRVWHPALFVCAVYMGSSRGRSFAKPGRHSP